MAQGDYMTAERAHRRSGVIRPAVSQQIEDLFGERLIYRSKNAAHVGLNEGHSGFTSKLASGLRNTYGNEGYVFQASCSASS